ncbi:M64 family metallopeptidase [Tellurirhabdus rosea]|uniref:M64 family metallopeptidase n=1 Tax=Tellurirhabdus rosea TaxID=2674997 RepID=UPI002258AFCB|nr:M64 family metallopeptidase [Tellurirhabdus rosea]
MKYYVTSLLFLWLVEATQAQRFPVDTLQKTGPLPNRVNIVIVGDGFTAQEMNAFSEAARRFMNAFLESAPYRNYQQYFNFFAIQVPSKESGATNPGTAPDAYPDQPVETKDTYFGASFGALNIHRLVVVQKYSALTNVLAENFPAYSQVVVIVNSPWYGGSGGPHTVFTLHSTAYLIALHEMGHSFGFLKDEYWAGEQFAAEAPNMTRNSNPATVVWKAWLQTFNIGVFGHGTGWYKPTSQQCLMERLDQQLCAVCREATVRRILQRVNPVEGYNPATSGPVVVRKPETFRLNLLRPFPNTLRVEWRLDGALVGRNTDEVTLSPAQIPNRTGRLTATVADTTDLIRMEGGRPYLTYNRDWNLDRPLDTLRVRVAAARNPVCLGSQTVLTAEGCLQGTVVWSTGQSGPTIAVQPTAPTTYTATCSVGGAFVVIPGQITMNVSPRPDIRATNSGPALEGETVTLTATGGISYAWTGPDGFVSAAESPRLSNIRMRQAGQYVVEGINADGCQDTARTTVVVSPLLQLEERLPVGVIRVYPNPARDLLTVETSLSGEVRFQLFDLSGRLRIARTFESNLTMPLADLAKGVYFYRITQQGRQTTGKVMVE